MAIIFVKVTDESGRTSWQAQTSLEDAPNDNKEYIRKNGRWTEKAASINEGGGLTQPQIMARNLGC